MKTSNRYSYEKWTKYTLVCISVLPMATYEIDSQWFVSRKERVNFTIVCDRMTTPTVTVDPPIQVVKLNMVCSATTDTLTLPSYHHDESKYIKHSLVRFTYTFHINTIKIGESFHTTQYYQRWSAQKLKKHW